MTIAELTCELGTAALMHRCPICRLPFEAGIYAHGAYADHMILGHGIYGQPPCDDDCAGCVEVMT